MAMAAEVPGNAGGLGEGEAHSGTGDGTEVNTDHPTYLVIDYGDTWRRQLEEVRAEYQRQLDGMRQEMRLLGFWLRSYFGLIFPALLVVFVHLVLQMFISCQQCQQIEEVVMLLVVFFDILYGMPSFLRHTRKYHEFLAEHGSYLLADDDDALEEGVEQTVDQSGVIESKTTDDEPNVPAIEDVGAEGTLALAGDDNGELPPSEIEAPNGNLLDFD